MLNGTFSVAGVTFNGRQHLLFDIMHKTENYYLTLRRNPHNRYDPNTIAVILHSRNNKLHTQIGIVPPRLAARLSPEIDSGKTIKVNFWQVNTFHDEDRLIAYCRINYILQ